MIRNHFNKKLLFILALALFSCAEAQPPEEEVLASAGQVQSEPIPIKTQAAIRGNFPLRILTNGTLRASKKLDIKLQSSGTIAQLPIQTGKLLKAGDLIAQLDDRAVQLQLRQAQLALEEAEVKKADLLIANGGTAYQDASVSADKLQLINTSSGYNRALHAIEQAQYELSKTALYAPFAGVVAEVKCTANQEVSAGEVVCTLLATDSFEALFTLLEQDALTVNVGQTVKVQPTAIPNTSLQAKVSAINPIVNEQGLVTLHAVLLPPYPKQLFDGMNLQIAVEQMLPRQLIIPRSAVVMRSGKAVVFTYAEAAQAAKWNYVTVAHENDTHVAVSTGLSDSDLVIYEGNLNLDHDAAVTLTTAKQ